MVKKLYVLRAKRGFTLVELIVVIAIIAVLAALITPVMMGYVENANIQSANNSAAKICQFVGNFMVSRDVKDEGMKLSDACVAEYKITINGNSWEIVGNPFDEDHFNSSKLPWSGGTSKPITQGETNLATAEDELALLLAESFPPVKDATAWIYLEGGKCKYGWFCRGDAPANPPTKDDFETGTFAWNGEKDGVSDDGKLVGTCPPLLIEP